MNPELPGLMKKYQGVGRIKGKHLLLLRPVDAVAFADELARIGVAILGIELWYPRVADGKEILVENPYGPDFSYMAAEDNASQKSSKAAKQYLSQELPEDVTFVSFVLDDNYYSIFPEEP